MSEIRLAFLKTIEYTAGAVTFNIFFCKFRDRWASGAVPHPDRAHGRMASASPMINLTTST